MNLQDVFGNFSSALALKLLMQTADVDDRFIQASAVFILAILTFMHGVLGRLWVSLFCESSFVLCNS